MNDPQTLQAAAQMAENIPPIVSYLLIAIGGLGSACVVMFWQVLQAKKDTLDLAKEVIPVATTLQRTVEGLIRLIERLERELEKKP